MKFLAKLSLALALCFLPMFAFAIDTTAITTEMGTAVTDVTAVFAAMSAVIGLMFVISKIRQLSKA